MKVSSWCGVVAAVALAACSGGQPVPVADADLQSTFGNGAQVQFDKGSMTFFGDKTVSREMTGSAQIDDGTWRIDGGKLCIAWKSPAAPESCLTQVRVGSKYEARNDDGTVAMSYTLN